MKSKKKIQNRVRYSLYNLGYKEYMNASTDKILELLQSLYPECVSLDENLTNNQKKEFIFTEYLKIAEEHYLNFTRPAKAKKGKKKALNAEEQNLKVIEIFKKLGYTDLFQKNRTELYYMIKELHPELTVFSGSDYYMKKTFKTFIKLYTDNTLSEEQKKEILQQMQRERENKINRVNKKKNKIPKNKSYKELSDEFYHSREWMSLRYSVLKEQDGKCQLCGRSRKDGIILHVDHIIPLSKDWSKRLDRNNLQVLCKECNLGKSNTDSIDWR